jgi:shikimate dehydrogenase
MRKAGVIGHPIAHSKSPLVHRHWLTKYGIDGEYEAYDIVPECLGDRVQELVEQGLSGFNVTLPHKQNIINFCGHLDEGARKIGAVNTVVVRSDGMLEGRNTDAFGFLQNARETQPDFDFSSGPAVILGAGGAARAAAYALRSGGVSDIRISNRTREHAEIIACDFGAAVWDWEERGSALRGAASLINTTSLGMTGKPPLDISLDALPETALVYDIVYAPLETDLLKNAREKGCRIVTGIGMLLHQARPAFEAWFGILPDIDEELRRKVLA